MQVRENARALLINPLGQILLEKIDVDVIDPGGKITSPYWLTPGGAIEPGETPAQAIVREIREECGIDQIDVDSMVWYCEHPLIIWGTAILSRDCYFLVRTPNSRVVTDGMEFLERAMHCEHRWWLTSEIIASTEVFAPPNLGRLLEKLLASGKKTTEAINIPW